MTRLRFLITSALATVASMVPFRRRYTVDEWCAKHGITLTFTHRPENLSIDLPRRSVATLMVRDQPRTARFISQYHAGPQDFERRVKESLCGKTQQFHTSGPIYFDHCASSVVENWQDLEALLIPNPELTLVAEVHFPADLLA